MHCTNLSNLLISSNALSILKDSHVKYILKNALSIYLLVYIILYEDF